MASLHKSLNHTLLCLRTECLLFGIVSEAILISFSENSSVEMLFAGPIRKRNPICFTEFPATICMWCISITEVYCNRVVVTLTHIVNSAPLHIQKDVRTADTKIADWEPVAGWMYVGDIPFKIQRLRFVRISSTNFPRRSNLLQPQRMWIKLNYVN